jgi:AbrB family looped-hinge helix DNA binding protein
MTMFTVNAKGQITLGKDVVKHLGAHPGGKVVVEKLPEGRLVLRAVPPTGDISDAFGFVKRKGGPSLSLEDINKLTTRGWVGKR